MITSASAPVRPGRTARRRTADAALAAAVAALQAAAWLAAATHRGYQRPGPAAYLLLAAGAVSLLARRRYPAPVLAVALAAALAAAALGGQARGVPVGWFVLVAAFVNAVVYRQRAAAIASLVAGYLVSVWPPWLIGRRGNTSAVFALALLAGLITLLLAAELIRVRNQRAVAVKNRQAEQARRLASEERLAIARDLHDLVAHNISVINVQANTALHLMERHPERAREALTAIHEVSRQALGELRSVLGVLRAEGDDAPLVPSPGLDRLGELAAHARAAGFTVLVEQEGTSRPVPAGVDAAAYRIIQEALTNTVRHSGGRTAVVHLRYDADALTIEVDDDGRTVDPRREGNGVAGMTERARALGGTLDAGPGPAGGFRVLARLPTPT
ncbi:MAG TPA: sensor histidine kinase [Streptosporangiaceae bacterium]|nr:sensor histidine kinase [Streptosporangiaceae bacterium]